VAYAFWWIPSVDLEVKGSLLRELTHTAPLLVVYFSRDSFSVLVRRSSFGVQESTAVVPDNFVLGAGCGQTIQKSCSTSLCNHLCVCLLRLPRSHHAVPGLP
jgi:hypothetical protein